MSEYCYEDHSNFFSWMTYCVLNRLSLFRVSFINKLFKIGRKRPLVEADLGKSSKAVKPGVLYNDFAKEWNKEREKPVAKRSFFSAIIRATGKCHWAIAIILNILTCFLTFVPTLILNILVRDLEGSAPLSNSLIIIYMIHSYWTKMDLYSHLILHSYY